MGECLEPTAPSALQCIAPLSVIVVAAIAPLAGDAQVGVLGKCPHCDFTAACTGQLETGGKPDVWSISSAERKGPRGTILAGTPYNDHDMTD